MKRILMDLACKDEDFEFYADELQNQLDEPDEDAMVLLAYQSYDEDEQIPDIMKRDKIKVSAEEALRYGEIKFDITSDEKEGCRRIRVVRLNGEVVVVHQFNGEVIECYEV